VKLNQVKRSILLLVIALVGVLSISLSFATNVFAASIYDNTIQTTDSLVLTNYDISDTVDMTTNYMSYVAEECGAVAASDLNAVVQAGGQWGIHLNHSRNLWQNGYKDNVNIYFTPSTESRAKFADVGDNFNIPQYRAASKWIQLTLDNSGSVNCYYSPTDDNLTIISADPTADDPSHILFSTFDVLYPSGYMGEIIPTPSDDADQDGLTGADEIEQGTSDFRKDTDNDGLDDYIESQWNPDRDEVFCGTQCSYPDPTTKDVYVEVDWMNNPNDSSYQPSSSQLNQVKSAFNSRGVNIHFDTGQYGGGSELPTYEHTLPFAQDSNGFDFYDYKNGTATTSANFSSDRKRIWHYMISGYKYAENTGSSGVSYAGDDDFFISYGLIKDGQPSFGYANLDTAIAGTIIHELGHNLCLTDMSAYSGQAGECVYDGIDNVNASSDYESSMNYSYQMFMVDYSYGINGIPNDHDDWYAVNMGLKDFSNTDRDAGDVMNGKSKVKKTKRLIHGITIEQAKELRKENKLGKSNMNYFTRQLQMPVR